MRPEVVEFLKNAWGKPLSVDTETNAKDPRFVHGKTNGVSVTFMHRGYYWSHYFPFKHPDTENNYSFAELQGLKQLLENAPELFLYNAKFDITALEKLDISIGESNWFDALVASSMINENWPFNRSLDNMSKLYLKDSGKEMSVEFKTYRDILGWDAIPSTVMRPYAEKDAELHYRMGIFFKAKFLEIYSEELWVWKRQFINAIRQMEIRGISIDQDYCRKMEDTGRSEMERISDFYGINIASTKELSELLHDEWGLPPIFVEERVKEKGDRLTKKIESNHRAIAKLEERFSVDLPRHWDKVVKLSLDSDALKEYKKMLPTLNLPDIPPNFVDDILTYRGWAKASSSYYGAYLDRVNEDGKLRPNYIHHKSEDGGTVTGRLACANPNLQQIPRESNTPWGGVKKSFIPSAGYQLWEVDYSQLELRLLVAYSGDEFLKTVFMEGRDLFSEMSGQMSFPRQVVKQFVYMTNYGAGVDRVSKYLEITHAEASRLWDKYYTTYPSFLMLASKCNQSVKSKKYIDLWSGRRRNFTSEKDGYKAMNSLIQGGSADIVERIMVRLWYEIDQQSNNEVRMLLTVHDSVWFEIKEGTEGKWIPKIKEIMMDVVTIGLNTDVVFAVEFELK